MPVTGAMPILTIEDIPAHRAVPGRQRLQMAANTASVTGPTVPRVQPFNSGAIITGDCTNDITYYPTNVEVWDAWNEVYTLTASYVNTAATTANLYALQTGLNSIAMEATMTGDTWTAWNVRYAASTITTTNTFTVSTWDAWNDDFECKVRREIAAGRRPSAEQQEKWRQDEIARKAAEEKRLREEITAKDKAILLLKSCLTPQQLEEYEKKKCFHLHVGGKVYRIEQGSHGNVKLVDKDGKVKRSFCVSPRGVPDGDTMLAQKLMLETDEKRFYELANVTEYGADGHQLRTLGAPRGADLLREVQQQTG